MACRTLLPASLLSSAAVAGATRFSSGRAEIAQLVEHVTENHGVASSILALGTTNPVGWSGRLRAGVAQLVERHLAKVKVAGSNPVSRSILSTAHEDRWPFV